MLIRLHGCAGWSVPLLFAYGINRFSHDLAHLASLLCALRVAKASQTFLQADSEASYQTGRIRRLIPVFTGHIGHFACFFLLQYKMSKLMTEPTNWHVRPAKTQISLGILPVWSVFAVRMKKAWVMPRLIWVFAGRTVILLVLSWGGSNLVCLFVLRFDCPVNKQTNGWGKSKGPHYNL